MSRALVFRGLTVRRMPGFPGGGPRLSELSPGINLIHGPNASGKTTVALALQSLLWPQSAPATAGLEGHFELGGARWRVDVESRRPAWQQDGRDSPAPPLPPADDRDRYLLSLHGLLRADDRDLAERIRVESAGGYDVRAAAAALGLSPGGRPNKLVDGLAAARETLARARERESELRDEVARLERLRDERRDLERTAHRLEPLRQALRLARARDVLAEARRAVAAFPDAMDRLHGDELERLDELARRREECDRAISKADADAAGAAAELAALGLGEDGVPGSQLATVESRLEALRRLEYDQARIDDARGDARARRQRAGTALGIDPERDALPTPAGTDMDRIDRFLRRVESLRERRTALEERIRVLSVGVGPDVADVAPDVAATEAASQAVRVLRGWLRTGVGGSPAEARTRSLFLAATATLALTGVAAAALAVVGPGGWWLVAGGILLVVASAVLLALRPVREADGRAALERQATRLGHVPARWTADAVEGLLDELEGRLVADRAMAERVREAGSRAAELRDLAASESEVEAERQALATELGLAMAPGDLALHLVATRLRDWEEARSGEAGADGLRNEVRRRRADTLSAAAEALRPFGYVPAPADADELAGALADLRARRERHQAADSALLAARKDRDRAARERDGLDEQHADLFDAVGLTEEQEQVLRERVRALEAFRTACSELELAGREHDAAVVALAERPERAGVEGAVAIPVTELERATVAELERAVTAAAEASSAERELAKTIAGIEARLADARQKHDVEDALSGVAAAEAELMDRRDQDVEAAVGGALVEWLGERNRDRNRPAVFHRARQRFGLITRGRYRLDMDGDDGVAFRAYDLTTHRGHRLDQLSSGTRLQLLLAVRVAFVETQETGAALPLLLDEVLANCDDDRAAAIIDAAIALARDGRQIFYFTAQADELLKWQSRLAAATGDPGDPVDWCIRGILDGADARESPGMDWPAAAATEVPAPHGLDHASYGRILNVPPFDPWADGVGGLHLWYLVEDLDALHQLLAMGVSRWGQLEYLATTGGDAMLPGRVHEALIEEVSRTAALCDRFRQLWRQGRARPVDRQVLVDSGAVSDAFLDRVVELCDELKGDGAALVDALIDGRVPRFRSAQAEELRAFLQARGCVNDDEPLAPAKIRVMLLAEAGTDPVDRLLRRLVPPPTRGRTAAADARTAAPAPDHARHPS